MGENSGGVRVTSMRQGILFFSSETWEISPISRPLFCSAARAFMAVSRVSPSKLPEPLVDEQGVQPHRAGMVLHHV